MAMPLEDEMAFDMPFAKVVSTPQGDGLLIGFTVFHVTGPDGNAADLFAKALRRGHRADSSIMPDRDAGQQGLARNTAIYSAKCAAD